MPGPEALRPFAPASAPTTGRATTALALRRRSDRLLAAADAVTAVVAAWAAGELLHRTSPSPGGATRSSPR